MVVVDEAWVEDEVVDFAGGGWFLGLLFLLIGIGFWWWS